MEVISPLNESNLSSGHVPEDMAASAPALSPLRARDEVWVPLVRRIAQGEQAALGSLYDESSAMIYGLAMKMLADPQDAEEVVADVYAQVWRAAATFEVGRGSVSTWLVMLTRSRAIDRIRSRAERTRREQHMDEHFEATDQAAAPDEAAEMNQQRRMVQSALTQLPSDQRRLIQLAFFRGLSHAELAEETGVPLGTVKTRIRLGMKKLRESLAALEGGL